MQTQAFIVCSLLTALSGQFVDVNTKKVSFSPKIKPPFKLPFMIPTVWGSLQSEIIDTVNHTAYGEINSKHLQYTFALEFGKLEFTTLTAGDCKYQGVEKVVTENSLLRWSCPFQE